MKLSGLYRDPLKKHKTPGDITRKRNVGRRFLPKLTTAMPSMHEVPHMDGTHGNVPTPGKPKWFQRSS